MSDQAAAGISAQSHWQTHHEDKRKKMEYFTTVYSIETTVDLTCAMRRPISALGSESSSQGWF